MLHLKIDKPFFLCIIFFTFLIIFSVFPTGEALSFSAAGPLPFRAEVNAKNINANTIAGIIEKHSWIEAAQTHAGPVIVNFARPDNLLYQKYLEKYAEPQQLRWLDVAMTRADLYIDFIDDLIAKNNLPPELLFLPVVESSYRQNAISRSGAMGIWQFMRNSVAEHDIKIDDWVDERKDFWKSTEGALAKLKYNYDVLGDWLLALAAYNCGLGRMQRIIKASNINDYWELSEKNLLPIETINYIPKLLAVADILTHRGRIGLSTPWRAPVKWERVNTDYSVSITRLAKATDIPYNLLKTVNMELRYDITPGGKNYYLKVPEGKGAIVKDLVAASKEKLMRFHMYRIASGDTLYALALHYRVSVDMILNYNRNLSAEALPVGRKILVPALRDISPYKGKSLAAITPLPYDSIDIYTASYEVEKGDTLWSVARSYGTTVRNLAYHNRLKETNVLYIGANLKVPESEY